MKLIFNKIPALGQAMLSLYKWLSGSGKPQAESPESVLSKRGNAAITFGSLSFASFIISAFSGLFLAFSFDIRNPYDSVALILINDPLSSFFRNVHYWSSQLFIVTLFLHAGDHILKKSGKRVGNGVWFRLALSLAVSVLIMLTGFIVRGDSDSLQAGAILSSLFESIPFIGASIAYFLLGREGDLQLPYFHHIFTAAVFLWYVIVEHFRKLWPGTRSLIYASAFVFLISLLFTPGIHDNYSGNMRGPWYLLGLQEIFHWISWPEITLAYVFVLLLLLTLIPWMNANTAWHARRIISNSFLVYFGLCFLAFLFRGENWELRPPWSDNFLKENVGIHFIPLPWTVPGPELSGTVPVVLGRREGCLVCHSDVRGLSVSHDPSVIGCYSCHMGNPFSIDKNTAHRSMLLIPGTLDRAEQTCGNQKCHPDIPDRVENSIMNTMSGVISVDKYVFGEIPAPSGHFDLKDLKNSPADNHLKNLCASCHIGGTKPEYGPSTQESRGGGCLACHLNYNEESLSDLKMLSRGDLLGYGKLKTHFHPDISIKTSSEHCFGCHSRSGRISLSYEGWHETGLSPSEIIGSSKYRILDDGRVVTSIQPDVHYQKGMICTDCHVSKELMGDGARYEHKEDQLIIQCTDCHSQNLKFADGAQNDYEISRLLFLRKIPPAGKYVVTEKGKTSYLYNILPDSAGIPWIRLKNKAGNHPLKRPLKECIAAKAHSRLSCNTCHSSWAPQCIGCHTQYRPDLPGYDLLNNRDIQGSWEEVPGVFLADLPVLGIKSSRDKNGSEKEIIDNFIPGMILTIDRSGYPASEKKEKSKRFQRLYSPAFSHTVQKKVRSCQSCHNNPLALGFGRGKLQYSTEGGRGKWTFVPAYKLSKWDQLPEDAWTGFLQERSINASTRIGARPFNIKEQKKILTAGSCFFCHKPESFYIRMHLINPDSTLLHLSPKCLLPLW